MLVHRKSEMTAITVELDDITSQTLSALSKSEGRDMPHIASKIIKDALLSQNGSDSNNTNEIDLIMQARQELPEALWRRYRQLTNKRRNETIAEDEYTELLDLGDTLEIHHVKRVEASAQIAKIWKRDLEEVMRILGVRPRNV